MKSSVQTLVKCGQSAPPDTKWEIVPVSQKGHNQNAMPYTVNEVKCVPGVYIYSIGHLWEMVQFSDA